MSYLRKETGARSGLLKVSQAIHGIDPIKHCEQTKDLEGILNTVVNEELKKKISVASYEDGILTVFCQNAASASVLNYEAKEYVELLRQENKFRDLISINARVA